MAHFEFNREGSSGTKLYFQGWEAEGPAKGVVCLVHGLGEHSGRYAHVAEWLNRAGYQLVSFDLPGHGKSGGKRGDLPVYDVLSKEVTLLLSEARSRFPSLPQVLYGHSLGGLIVLYYILRLQPKIAAAVVTSPGLMTALHEQKGKVALAKLLGSVMPGMVMASGLDVKMLSRDPSVFERYQNDPLIHDRMTLGSAKNSMEAIRYIFENPMRLQLPLLLMHGTGDQLTYPKGSQEFASMVTPGYCTLRLWPGFFHELHNEPGKEEVFGYLISYLDEVTSKAA